MELHLQILEVNEEEVNVSINKFPHMEANYNHSN